MRKLIPVLREAVRPARPSWRPGPACVLLLLAMPWAAAAQVPVNTLPIRIGADQQGHNVFRGEMAAVRIYERPLAAEEVKRQAGARPDAASRLPGLVAEWLPGGLEPGKPLPGGGRLGPATAQGAVQAAVVEGVSGGRFAGGHLTIPTSGLPALDGGCTVEAWIRPAGGAPGRIVDKITPGGVDGFLLDLQPGNQVRFILGPVTVTGRQPPPGKWMHVAATVEEDNRTVLYVDGADATGGTVEETVAFTGSAPAPESPLALWYRRPAARWTEALAIGNGRLGGMVWGGVRRERIDLNEDTLWSGEPYDNINTNGLAALPEIRRLLLAGKNQEAQRLVEQKMNGKYNQCYMPLGDLSLEFPLAGAVSNYRRELDLAQAIARVEFEHEGTLYTREIFASHPAQAIVVRLTANRPGRISFTAALGSQLRHSCQTARSQTVLNEPQPGAGSASSGTITNAAIVMTGRCPLHADPHYVGKRVIYDDTPAAQGMRFEAQLMVQHTGGRLRVAAQTLEAEGCDEVILLLVAATSFNGPHRSPSREGRNPTPPNTSWLRQNQGRSYAELRQEHLADYQRLFHRVELDLGRPADKPLPTNQRLRAYQPGRDPALAALYYQFGRYLLIASSRPGTQPANLQGIWNHDINPPWSANWTLNCNAQINYWPAETGNLGECHLPLVDLTRELSVDGTNIARNLYGARGWMAHHNTDLWRQAGPVSGSALWSIFQVGGAWLCQHAWERYAYSGDVEYLRQVWPVLKGAARFFLDNLMEEPTHHWLVTGPDTNFENTFRKPDGTTGCTCLGPTASMEMVRELFQNCLQASLLLNEDADLRAELQKALPRLPPLQISPTTGELQEWVEDWARTAECQVLSSWGAVCSAQITPRGTPAMAAALRQIFDQGRWWERGQLGSWQGAFQANVYARLGDGGTALAVLEKHIQRCANPNLTAMFPGHCEWQTDGNFGLAAAVGEMLLQSHETIGEATAAPREYLLHLLPARPEAWATGHVKGLRARGGFEVDLAWSQGRLAEARIRSLQGAPCTVRYGQKTIRLAIPRGAVHGLPGSLF